VALSADWQLSYNGLVVGTSTDYDVVAVDGLDGLPELRTSDTVRPSDHGMFAGRDLAAGRTIELTLEIYGATDGAFRTNVDALGVATLLRDDELALAFKLPGFTDDRQVFCRPRRRSLPLDLNYSSRLAPAIVQFFATDPRIYAATETVLGVGLPAASGGLAWPLVWPLSWGTATSGTVSADNAGTFPTRPVVRFDGPLTGASIENVTAGKTFRFKTSFVIAAGEYVEVDFNDHTVLLNGTASRYSQVASNSQWWEIAPGANEVRLGGVSGSGTADITFRSAWI
jgi:hypothetical protein